MPKQMKLPNGFGNINKLSGNRRNPFRARVAVGYSGHRIAARLARLLKRCISRAISALWHSRHGYQRWCRTRRPYERALHRRGGNGSINSTFPLISSISRRKKGADGEEPKRRFSAFDHLMPPNGVRNRLSDLALGIAACSIFIGAWHGKAWFST